MKLDFNNSKILKCLCLHILKTYEITQNGEEEKKKTPFKDIQTKCRINKKETQNKTNICKNIKSH